MDFPDPDDRLDSWKEIAAFLGRTPRTVQRWEKTAGLPVTRGGAGPRSSVIASRRELSEWWLRQRDTLTDDEVEREIAPPPGTSSPLPLRQNGGWRAVAAGILVLLAVATVVVAIGGKRSSESPPLALGRVGRLLPLSTSEGSTQREIELPQPAAWLAVSPDGRAVYASIPSDDSIAVVDVETSRVVDRLPGVDGVGDLDVTPDGRTLLLAGGSGLALIDVQHRTKRVVYTDRNVVDVRATANGRRAWITLAQGGMKVLDLATFELTTVPTIGCPMFLAYGPRTNRMFVSYQCTGPGGRPGGHDALEVFDEPTRRSVMTRSGPPMVGSRLALSPDEQYLWADTLDACSAAEYDHMGCPPGAGPVLVAYRAQTMEPLAITRLPTSSHTGILDFFPDGSRLLVSSDGLNVLSAALGRPLERLAMPVSGDVKFSPKGDRVFATVPGKNRILDLPIGPPEDARGLPGLVTYWTGDGTANDSTGGMYALPESPVHFGPGRLGSAFSFDGKSPGISFGRRIDIDITDISATFAAWVRPLQAGADAALVSRASFKGWRWWLAGGRPAFCFMRAPGTLACDQGGLVAPDALKAGAWSHVAVVRGESEFSIFIDGRRVAAASMGGYESPPGKDYDEEPIMRLGADRDGSRLFAGLIDEVVMFRSALDTAALARLMQLTTAPPRREP